MREVLLATVLLALATGCAPRAAASWPPADEGLLKPVWVVRHGWHTRIAVRRADVKTLPGSYEKSWFYLAGGRYHVLDNSNNWTIRALQAAGAPVNPAVAFTAGNVVAQAARIGERLDRDRTAQP